MTDFPESQGPNVAQIPASTRTILLTELEDVEHLLFEPMHQTDLNGLYGLHTAWCERLGDAPQAIALCNALAEFIEACIEDDGAGDDSIERAYLSLVATVQEGGGRGEMFGSVMWRVRSRCSVQRLPHGPVPCYSV